MRPLPVDFYLLTSTTVLSSLAFTMRVGLLAFALLSSVALGEQCLSLMKRARLPTFYLQPPLPSLGPLRRATGARHASSQ